MPKFIKGSQEAKDHMAKIREAKKNPNKKPPNPNKGIRSKNKKTNVEIPIMNTQEIAIPEFFATKNTNKKGVVSYKLVNPLTKTRNLSKRKGEPSIKLIRKPIDHMILMEHSTEPIPLSMFSKKDREIINNHFKVIDTHKDKEIKEIPQSQAFENKPRGRPEKLPKNIEYHKAIKKANKPKKYATEEERKEAIKEQKRKSAKKIYDAKKQNKGITGGKLSVNHLKGLLNASYDSSINNVDDFVKDNDLSGDTTKVFHNSKTGQTVVAHKGTDSATDWSNNGVYAIGGESAYKMTPRYKEAEKIQRQAEAKYGAKNISTIGHSQSGLQAELLGKDTKEIITLNKATRPLGNTVKSNQTDIRTTGDVVSGNNPFQKKNGKEIVIQSKTSNPLEEHKIDVLNQLDGNKLIGEGIQTNSGKILKHLVSHITDTKEPVDKRDFIQAKMVIDDIKKMKSKRKSKGIKSNTQKKNISNNNIMPKIRKAEIDSESSSSSDSDNDNDMSKIMGGGIHHHHYYIQGNGAFDFLNPKKNGLSKAVSKTFSKPIPIPKAVSNTFSKPIQIPKAVSNTFSKKNTTNFFEHQLPSTLIHKGIPIVAGVIGSTLAEAAVPEGGPVSGFIGNQLGKQVGNQIANQVGKKTGYGFKKGSQEAKDHMAKIRAMKGKGITGKVY